MRPNFMYCCRLSLISFIVYIGLSSYSPVYAAGLTIPANCTLDVAACALVIPGDVDNSGTLRTTTGSITVSGNWVSSGVFTSGTGTVTFNGTAGTQILNTGGLANAFYNLSHNAASTLSLTPSVLDINNNFSNTAGTFAANNINVTIGKDWTNTGTFTPGTNTVILDGTNQSIVGTTSFYNLTKITASADTLTFSANGTEEQTVTHLLTLKGAIGQLLSLEKSGGNAQAKLKLQSGGAQAMQYLSVHNNNATGIMLVAGLTSTDAGNNTNWSFGNGTFTWSGVESTDWDDPFNWSGGVVPAPGDSITIVPLGGGVLYQPVLSTNVTIANLTLQANSTLTLSGKNITVTSTFTNSGNLILKGTETLNITQDTTNPGTFTYVGTNTGTTITIRDFGANDYYNLVINDSNGTQDLFITNGNLTTTNNLTVTSAVLNTSTNSNAVTVAGTLTVNGGTLTATNSTIDVNGAVVVSSGTLTAPSSTANTAFTVAGNWTHSGGTFTANSGKVTLDGTGQTIAGSSTFYQLRKVVAAADTLTLTAATTQTVSNNLVLTGASGQLLSVRSTVNGSAANINLQAGGTQTINYVDVKDNTASGVTLVATTGSTNSGNNTNWIFGGATITWTGTTSTDWDTTTNWDLGIVPTAIDFAVVTNVANAPILATNVTVATLTTNVSSNLTLNGKNLTTTGALTNNGTITMFGSETLSFGTMDTAHGTFAYVGNGDGVVDTMTIRDFGATDYYNLLINDTHGTKDVFITNGNLTLANNLNVTSSSLNISTNTNILTTTGTLTVDGGTLTATNGTIDANGAVVISSGTFTAPSSTGNTAFTVAGNWTNSGGTFTANGGKVTFDGTSQTIAGNTTFYRLRKVVAAADTWTLTAASTQTITNDLTLSGASGQALSLRSSVNGSQANLTLQSGATQTINYVDVKDNSAAGGILLLGRSGSTNSGNNTNWAFGGATMTWTGTTSTDWDVPTNWNLGIVPTNDDTAIIANVATQPILSTDVTVTTLTTNASSIMALNGKNLTVSGIVTNNGTITLFGSETLTIGTWDTAHGTMTYLGNGDGVVDTFTVRDFGTTDYYNLIINDTHATKDIFITNAALTIAGNLNVTSSVLNISTNTNTLTTTGTLTVDGGTLTATNGNIDANGSVVISSGALTAPTTSKTFTVAGSWTHSGGTFTHSSGRVTMDTTTTALIVGDTTFYDWYSTTGNKQLTFTAGTNQTVNNLFNFVGAIGAPITFRSSSTGTTWSITSPTIEQTVSQIDVKDSVAITNRIVCLECTDSGNTTNWLFIRLALAVPADQRTIGQVPVIIGTGPANTNIRIKGVNESGTEVIVATTRSDAAGNYRIVLGQDYDTDAGTTVATGVKLKVSSSNYDNYLTPYILNASLLEVPGPSNALTVAASTTTAQVPTITSPANGSRVSGNLPTIVGNGKPGDTVTAWGSDSDGNLLISSIGSSTVDGSGNYSFPITTALKKGANYISVVVNGVSSDLSTYYLTDPFGYVFDSTRGDLIKDAVVSIYRSSDNQLAQVSTCDSSGNITTLRDLACTDTNPYTTGVDGFYSFLTVNGNYYMTVTNADFTYPSVLTTFPNGKVVTTGSKGETFTVNNAILQIDHPVDINRFLLRIEKSANKTEVRIGDVITYAISIQNLSSTDTINSIHLFDRIPAGFKYLSNRVLLDGVSLAEPTGNRPLDFNIGSIGPGITKTLKYQLVVGAGVSAGTYENVAQAKYANGLVISNKTSKAVKVVMDSLFDMGTVIGKVYFDLNENGLQDAPEYDATEGVTIIEKPLPNVQIATEDGTVITTDRDGKYSWPGVLPGRHMLRVDERTLPPGAYFTTDKAVVVDVTNGSISKVNFGVNMDNTQVVGQDAVFFNERIALNQDKNKPAPRLNAAMFSPDDTREQVIVYNATNLYAPAQWRIFTNYAPFIDAWELKIIDRDTKRQVKRFVGTRLNISDPILWNGRGDDEKLIKGDHHYAYVLSVKNDKGEVDTTMEKPIDIRVLETEDDYKKEKEKEALPDWGKKQAQRYRQWVKVQSAVNSLEQHMITIEGETVRINPQGQDIKTIRILKGGAIYTEIPLEQYNGISPKDILDTGIDTDANKDNVEIILPNGDYTVEVIGPTMSDTVVPSTGNAPQETPTMSPLLSPVPVNKPSNPLGWQRYSRPIKVGEDYFMFVGLGDAKIGYNINRGNVEPIQSSDGFQDKFWHQGKASYYLKGKIKGKYLVTSSFDTDRQQKALYRKLDPNTYYPIYGDGSSVSYDAANTQGPLFLMVQWDKSEAVWGNYAIDFKDTEFANYTRSFYGGKLDYQSVGNNPFGDPRTKVVVFHSEIQQRSAHNEFLGTGGSLYFLKNKAVVEGSDKIRIEVRDKVTGLVLSSKDMKNGSDYELDEDQGRILFWQPVAMIAKAESIVSSVLLDGNPVYVVADYEYAVQNKLNESSEGGRVAQSVGNNVVIGGTYVKETQSEKNYALQGTDVTAHLGPDATIKAEYAQTQSVGTSSFVSTDGGITFSQLQSGSVANGIAYGIKGDARLFNRLGVSSYYKWVEDSFTSVQSSSQQGKESAGLALTFDLTPLTRVTARTDIQKLINNGNLQTVAQVGASETSTTMIQIVHESERLKLTGAYEIQNVKNKIGDIVTQTNQVTKALAGKAEYALNGRITLTAGQQFDINNPNNNITTVGAEGKVTDRLKVGVTESFSREGTATTLGATQNVTDKLALSTAYSVAKNKAGETSKTTTFGAEEKFTDKISATASVSSTDSSTGQKTTSASVGTKASINLKNTTLEAVVGQSGPLGGKQATLATVAANNVMDFAFDKDTSVKTGIAMTQGTGGGSKTISIDASKRVNDNLTTTSSVKVDENAQGGKTTTIALSEQSKINDRLQAVSQRSFNIKPDGTSTDSKYSLLRDQDGKKLEGSITRSNSEDTAGGISQSNIFGLTGDVNDKLALQGSFEKGKVQNLDGSRTDRTVLSLGSGYVWKDPELAIERLKDSTKIEFRYDKSNENKFQYVFYNALEGKVTDNLSVSAKFEYAKTQNMTTDTTEARHKEIILGAAYRPVNFDRLNMIGQYAYKENRGPSGQSSGNVTDVEQSRAQVFSAEGVYDINDQWQLAEKFAFRINDEKVTGFEFNRTHTWLMIHRINYKLDRDWTLSTEYRKLAQVEAKDSKQGVLLEATRNINEFAQLGLGWNFTQFNDDLTDLNYTSQGPFLRMSGKLYDRTPEEKKRAKEKWLDTKVSEWAWAMVSKELQKPDSKVVTDLNHMFIIASAAQKNKKYEEAQQVYKDIIMAGQMMFDEASEFIRGQIAFEEKLQEYNKTAQEYYQSGEYLKARKLWEKIVADAQKGVVQ